LMYDFTLYTILKAIASSGRHITSQTVEHRLMQVHLPFELILKSKASVRAKCQGLIRSRATLS
jgi:hypothetical protein